VYQFFSIVGVLHHVDKGVDVDVAHGRDLMPSTFSADQLLNHTVGHDQFAAALGYVPKRIGALEVVGL